MGRHTEWRKLAKKRMRSRKRKLKAQERDKLLGEDERRNLKSPTYIIWQKEQEALELFSKVEEERLRLEENRKWIEREIQAQEEWKITQEKIALFKAEKAKQELIIRAEWDKEQKKIKEIEEKNQREKEAKEKREDEFKKKIEDFIAGVSQALPDGFRYNTETNPDKAICPFFSKVGACRFYDNCSRNHIKPSVSKTLVLHNAFSHFSMENKSVREYDTDLNLEFEETDMRQHFLDFYADVLPELQTYGDVTQFLVTCNKSSHLQAKVFVSYSDERAALKAYYTLSGRFYGGKQIIASFINVPMWSKAICGLFLKKKCPKGDACNFLHVFRNPSSEFLRADEYNSRNIESSSRSRWSDRSHRSYSKRDRSHCSDSHRDRSSHSNSYREGSHRRKERLSSDFHDCDRDTSDATRKYSNWSWDSSDDEGEKEEKYQRRKERKRSRSRNGRNTPENRKHASENRNKASKNRKDASEDINDASKNRKDATEYKRDASENRKDASEKIKIKSRSKEEDELEIRKKKYNDENYKHKKWKEKET